MIYYCLKRLVENVIKPLHVGHETKRDNKKDHIKGAGGVVFSRSRRGWSIQFNP